MTDMKTRLRDLMSTAVGSEVRTETCSPLHGFSKIDTIKKLYGTNYTSNARTGTPESRKSIRIDFSLDTYKKNSPAKKSKAFDYATSAGISTTNSNDNFQNYRGKTVAKLNNWETMNTITTLNSIKNSGIKKVDHSKRLDELLDGRNDRRKNSEVMFDLNSLKAYSGINYQQNSEDTRNSSYHSYFKKENLSKSGNMNMKIRKEIQNFSNSLNQNNQSYINRPTLILNKPDLQLNPKTYLNISPTNFRKKSLVKSGVFNNYTHTPTQSKILTTYNSMFPTKDVNFVTSQLKEKIRNKFDISDNNKSFSNLKGFTSTLSNSKMQMKTENLRERKSYMNGRTLEMQHKANQSVDDFCKELESPPRGSFIAKFSPKRKRSSLIDGSKSVLNPDEIVKEGFLVKQSKYRKVWRERWSVLTLKNLYTFKSERVYTSPTETIDVNQIKTVKSDENSNSNIFKIEIEGQTFCFQAKSFEDKEAWIGAIGKIMVKNSKPNIFIDEE